MGICKFEDDADVVYHEVEDYANLGSARIERREPVGGDKARAADAFFHELHHGVEMLYVANLHDEFFGFCDLHDFFGVGNRRANRLFYEQVAIFFEELHGDLRVPVGRNHDADGVARLAELRRRAEHAAAEPVGDFLRPRGVGVANPHELGAFKLRIYAGVVLSEIADAHYAALQLFAIVHTPATLPRPSAITSKYSPHAARGQARTKTVPRQHANFFL